MKTFRMYKWTLEVGGPQTIRVPEGVVIRHVGSQEDRPVIWAEVDPEREWLPRAFCVIGTGHPIPNHATYIGTAVGMAFVWHIYELAGGTG